MRDENPYAPPVSCDEAVRPAFRPDPFTAWFYYIVRGGDFWFTEARQSSNLVLRVHFIWRVVPLMAVIGAPIIMPILRHLVPPTPDEWWCPWFLAGFFLTLGVFGLLLDERVIVTAESIRKIGPFLRQRHMSWSDVVSVVVENRRGVVLVAVNGTSIEIAPTFVGVASAVDVIGGCLPHDVLEKSAIDLAKFRSFVGVSNGSAKLRN